MIACLSVRRRCRVPLTAALAALSVLALSGCGDESYPAGLRYESRTDPLILAPFKKYAPTHFDPPGHLNYTLTFVTDPEDRNNILDPANLTAGQRQQLNTTLNELFGTPHAPKVGGIADDVRDALRVDDATLAKGSNLYRLYCLHCHGLTGNGRGATAPWVNPHPRDYRTGIFKFTSSGQQDKIRKPRREDLLRTLRQGIEGTSMPSFGLLTDDELNQLSSYVIHLSIRGQVEFEVMREMLSPTGEKPEESAIPDKVNEYLTAISTWWRDAEKAVITPDAPYPTDQEASVKRGFRLFQKEGAGAMGCMSCHLDYGRQNNYLNDSWGTIVRAMDLTRGEYRGGRRPIDLYWRVHSGVNGANMPASSTAPSRDIWDLVSFLQILPYPEMRKKFGIDINQ